MEEIKQAEYECNDEGLGPMMARLFSEGNEEVVIRHPTEGEVIVTRADFDKHLANMAKVADMSPADKIEANKRLKNIKNAKQIRFRTALIDAAVHKVDFESDVFGVDIEGNELDIEDMAFIKTSDYPKGTVLVDKEVGVFYSEKEEKPAIRITGEMSQGIGAAE